MKKLITVLLTGMMVFSLCACNVKQKEDIYIIYTNDVHCSTDEIQNYATVAEIKKELSENHSYVTLVDAGDYVQGSVIGTLTKGESIIKLMNDAGYDVATIGNHEFDYGMDKLIENISDASFDVVACNIIYTGNGADLNDAVKPFVLKNYDGVKVAFVGVITPESLTSSAPVSFKENDEFVYDFYSGKEGQELYDVVQKNVDAARKQGARYVVVLGHLGTDDVNKPYSSYDVIQNTNGIDVFLDAHAHSVILNEPVLNKDGKEVLLTSTGTQLANIGELIIKTDGTFETLLISEYQAKDDATQSAIDEVKKEFEEMLNRKVADLGFDLLITGEKGNRVVRNRENSLGNLIADAFRYYYDADICLMNGGGVRKSVLMGEVTVNDLLAVLPFQNVTSEIYATGRQIVDTLEYTTRFTLPYEEVEGNAVGENGGFSQVSGIRYTIDTSVESTVTLDENNMMESIGENRRVTDVEVLENGVYVPIDLNKTYKVCGPQFVLTGNGDGITSFDGCETIVENGPVDIDLFLDYISGYLNGIIPEEYNGVQGRITVK